MIVFIFFPNMSWDCSVSDLKPVLQRTQHMHTVHNAGITCCLSPVWTRWCICIHRPQCGSITFVYPVFTPVHRYPPCSMIWKFNYTVVSLSTRFAVRNGNMICDVWGEYFRSLLDLCSNSFLSSTPRYLQMTVYSRHIHLFNNFYCWTG